jgi:hypothetical protein
MKKRQRMKELGQLKKEARKKRKKEEKSELMAKSKDGTCNCVWEVLILMVCFSDSRRK